MPLCHSRIKTFGDFIDLFDFLFINHLKYTPELFENKDAASETLMPIAPIHHLALDEQENWGGEAINKASREVCRNIRDQSQKSHDASPFSQP